MSQIPSFGTFPPAPQASNTNGNGLQDVNMDEFLQLMITELQNQDPLDPMDNSELLAQISQIREISSTDQLSETLGAVRAGQNFTTASSIIGKEVQALSDNSEEVRGVVDRVSMATEDATGQRVLRLHSGPHQFSLENVREIIQPGT